MQDTETQEEKHVRIARHFLNAADKLFDEGDYVQTSEKLWGATSHALKALCIRRRWPHGKYVQIRDAAGRLSEETGELIFTMGYGFAYHQHRNFYNDDLEPHDIDFERPYIREMVEKVLTATGQNVG